MKLLFGVVEFGLCVIWTGINGGMDLRDGVDSSGRKGKVGNLALVFKFFNGLI